VPGPDIQKAPPAPPAPTYSGELPIHGRRAEILRALREHPVVVLAGETGSGKTTQIPKFLLEAGMGRERAIACTQPRRVAALSTASRLAEELGVAFGTAVGARIRFTDNTSPETAVKVMTDGILLNEIQRDPELTDYDAVVVDEAHERSLNIDFILGHLRQLRHRRPDLKIVVTSATIDTETFAQAFGGAPVVEVSGRMHPVETVYRPPEGSDTGDSGGSYLDAAATVVREILEANREGDILVFLPSERDIHELRRELEQGPARRCDLLPLFGRLANADQQRIFRPGGRRRIILATNIAETSITVPGIRFVVDSGLARVSRFSPHSRTQRLPIEPVARSSADQRKGRCGRVAEGVCYRLYSEDDYLSRPRFATPEIRRSNLASVILRLTAFGLGDIRDFPFIDPPEENAIRGGYRLLAELGAVKGDPNDKATPPKLTRLGERLARLPIDPTIGRMLLEAIDEGVVAEVLVIASGLSIQDPRERPADAPKEADAAQRRFVHPESDFLTLLNLWNAYHGEVERLTQSRLREFCKQHFLAYQRMREWRDMHHQLERILGDLKLIPEQRAEPRDDADYGAVHRSVLSGLLGNIARKEGPHAYRGARDRKAMLFPGSGLFDPTTREKERREKSAKKRARIATREPDWIVCGEWMETSRLFARNAARIEPEWIEALAGDRIDVRHSEPFWSERSARVLCRERRLLFGLEIRRANVGHTRVDPDEATDLFVRSGLIEERIRERPEFLEHNRAAREQAASEMARRRLGSPWNVEERLYRFYRDRLQGVGSYPELRSFAKEHHGGRFDFLRAERRDLLPEAADAALDADFPAEIELGGAGIPVRYSHAPGGEDDGVTLQVPLGRVDAVSQSTLDWAIPGHLPEKIEALLRALPKAVRKQIHPLKERARELADGLQPSDRPLAEQLARELERRHGIRTSSADWAAADVPEHLKPRVEVAGADGDPIAASRDLGALRERLAAGAGAASARSGLDELPAWREAAEARETGPLQDLRIGEYPESLDLSGRAGLPLQAFPALERDGENVRVRLKRGRREALRATREAWPVLLEQAFSREAAWIRRDLKDLKRLGPALHSLGGEDRAREDAWRHLRDHLFRAERYLPPSETRMRSVLERADAERKGLVPEFIDRLERVLEQRQAVERLLEAKKTANAITYPGMRAHFERIAPTYFLREYTYDALPDLERYLRAMLWRAERARRDIRRDMEKAKRVRPFEDAVREAEARAPDDDEARDQVRALRRMLEEFKVSVFAQELGARGKISEKRLQSALDQTREHLGDA